MNLVQFLDKDGKRHVASPTADGARLRQLDGVAGTRELALEAVAAGRSLAEAAAARLGTAEVSYEEVARDRRLLPPVDHPDPAHVLVTGTGLSHLGSAAARDAMHTKLGSEPDLTDSMKMFKLGLDGGKPAAGTVGVQPEWFYKGDGSWLAGPGQDLVSPGHALDGGEEPEIAGIYVIGPDGAPWRIGFALGNEFSDHVLEKQNYLYLAHSKLRMSSIGPELRLGALPADVRGVSRVIRGNEVVFEKEFLSGEANMSHSIANLEHHHFKYAGFRRPGDVHIHYFGTATLSFLDGVETRPGDVFEIECAEFGRPLRNALVQQGGGERFQAVGEL